MNSLDSLNAITRRALRINYQSPAVCLPDSETASGSGSGSSGSSSTLDFAPVYRKAGPTGLTASVVGGPLVELRWDLLSYAYVYIVYTSSTPDGPWSVIAAGVQETTYLATPAAGDNYYKVTAIEPDAGETLPSDIVGAITI